MSSTRTTARSIVIQCDAKGCHETIDTGTAHFLEAVEAAKEEGFVSKMIDGEWRDFCSEACAGAFYRDKATLPSAPSFVGKKTKPTAKIAAPWSLNRNGK